MKESKGEFSKKHFSAVRITFVKFSHKRTSFPDVRHRIYRIKFESIILELD